MGRELRRVPLDFNYPLWQVWYGHLLEYVNTCKSTDDDDHYCEGCKAAAKLNGVPFTNYGCPDWDKYLEEPLRRLKELLAPPNGEGYQLWETTSEGSPISPVFATLDELCDWCAGNATVFADIHVSKKRWREILSEYDDGTVIYEDTNNGVVII